jgi:light-independent protochlorophyllide reductase subunit B
MMGLEEHLLGMFREDFEFHDGAAPSHLGSGHGRPAKLAVPLLMIHGTADEVVPLAQGKELFAAARARKTFFEVKGGSHGNSLSRNNGEYRQKMLEWMAQY